MILPSFSKITAAFLFVAVTNNNVAEGIFVGINSYGGLCCTSGEAGEPEYSENELGFTVIGTANSNGTLSVVPGSPPNTQLIGAHLHTGNAVTNGPVNIAFCGSSPLPPLVNNGQDCPTGTLLSSGRYVTNLAISNPSSDANTVFENGGNNATADHDQLTPSLATGGNTTLHEFLREINACKSADGVTDECLVYFNIHTAYSFGLNAGAFGLARGQLQHVNCHGTLPPGYSKDRAICFIAKVTSANTNLVTYLPYKLPPNAGQFTSESYLIAYQGGVGSNVDLHPEVKEELGMWLRDHRRALLPAEEESTTTRELQGDGHDPNYDGFVLYGRVELNATLVKLTGNIPHFNDNVIGAHLHTGNSVTNGPVAISFCGSAPLPDLLAVNGDCNSRLAKGNRRVVGTQLYARLDAEVPSAESDVVFTNGGNSATSVSNAPTLATGKNTTFGEFKEELILCHQGKEPCNVYFNIHTDYDAVLNPAAPFGAARGQLHPVPCNGSVLPPNYDIKTAMCFVAYATSEKTNLVTNPIAPENQLPANTASVMPVVDEVLIVYQGGRAPPPPTMSPTSPPMPPPPAKKGGPKKSKNKQGKNKGPGPPPSF